ncbi:class IV adenylate cyclase [Streptomyces sp. NPDC088360]|uniref:class IV adenylate cyclase n=1 Tax=Streptomyces sp. NPDC088360 TaxID=3154515 RepID=UPI00344E32CD
MKYVEVEQKFRLLTPAERLKDQLTARDATPGTPSHQIDNYYNAPHRDFLDAGEGGISEWLRVRVEENSASLNFKRWHPAGEPVKTHCDEYETTVSDPQAVTLLLAGLDFKPLVTVDKVREEWVCEGIAVAFDTVAGLGTFIEFEFKGDTGSVEEATARIEAFIASLEIQVGDRINAGYPHLVLGMAPATA